MPFDNPYFPSQFDIGTPGAGHIHFANDGSMTLYAADGVTKIATLDPANSFQVFNGLNSVQVSPTSGAGNYPGILFNVSPHAHKGEIRAADQAGQGILHFHSPYDTDFSSIDLQSEKVSSNTPSFVGLRAGAASGINVTGTKPAGGAGSHGVISLGVGDDLGATQSVTWDASTFTVPGAINASSGIFTTLTVTGATNADTINASGGIFATDTLECDGSNAAVWTSVRSNNAGKWAMYSQAGTLAFYWNQGTGGSAGDKLSIDINGFVSCGGITTNGVGATLGILTASGAGGYGGDAAEFTNTDGAAAVRVGDGTRFSWVGTATNAGDWLAGSQSGDMVLRSTNSRVFIAGGLVTNGIVRFAGIGTRTTTVAGGTAQALPANPDGYVGININGVDKVLAYYH